jgi:hypothetical protein
VEVQERTGGDEDRLMDKITQELATNKAVVPSSTDKEDLHL